MRGDNQLTTLTQAFRLTHLHPAAPVMPAALAHRTLIFGSSATSRVDSARAHFCSHFFARASPSKRFPAPQGAILSAPRSGRKFLAALRRLISRAKMRAGGAPWRPSLKVARLEDDTGTSLDPLPRAPVVSDWQRRDGGGATRVGRCGEGDSGSQRPKSVAPSADEMTASSRRTRWRHRREPATRACGAHGKFVGCASGEPCHHEFVHS